jgi:hypothetical protein
MQTGGPPIGLRFADVWATCQVQFCFALLLRELMINHVVG